MSEKAPEQKKRNARGGAWAEIHHPDYSKPFDIEWLCRKHHLEQHAALREPAVKQKDRAA